MSRNKLSPSEEGLLILLQALIKYLVLKHKRLSLAAFVIILATPSLRAVLRTIPIKPEKHYVVISAHLNNNSMENTVTNNLSIVNNGQNLIRGSNNTIYNNQNLSGNTYNTTNNNQTSNAWYDFSKNYSTNFFITKRPSSQPTLYPSKPRSAKEQTSQKIQTENLSDSKPPSKPGVYTFAVGPTQPFTAPPLSEQRNTK
jgi:hypothetical protein